MAKIISVELDNVPNEINVGDNVNDVTVVTKLKFHDLDIKGKMEYCLHLFVYDVHGMVDLPLIVSNWDESSVINIPLSMDRLDDFLGYVTIFIKAEKEELVVKTPIALKLGSIVKKKTYFTRKLEVFATAAPIIGRVSKWSQPYETQVFY